MRRIEKKFHCNKAARIRKAIKITPGRNGTGMDEKKKAPMYKTAAGEKLWILVRLISFF